MPNLLPVGVTGVQRGAHRGNWGLLLWSWNVFGVLTHHLKSDRWDPKGSPNLSFCLLPSKLPGYFLFIFPERLSATLLSFILSVFISTSCRPKWWVLSLTFGTPWNWRLEEVLDVPSAELFSHQASQITGPVHSAAVKHIWARKEQTIPKIFTNLRGEIIFFTAAGHWLLENSLKCSPAIGFISLNTFLNAL